MKARNSFARLSHFASRLPSFSFPEETETARIERTLLEGTPTKPPENHLVSLAHRLREAASIGVWDSITSRDWADVAWILWDGSPEIISLPNLLDHYFNALSTNQTARAWRQLIHVFFDRYDPSLSSFDYLARTLSIGLPANNFRLDKWRSRHSKWSIFDIISGVETVGRRLLEERSPLSVEEELGLAGSLSESAFLRLCWQHALQRIEVGLADGTISNERLPILIRALETNNKLRFPGIKVDFANSLLRPWDQAPPPHADIRSLILEKILHYFGDPRLEPGRWHSVDRRAQNVFRRWLTYYSLEHFFRIVDASVKDDPEARKHWPYRRAFWLSYWQRGALDDAWLALGRDAQDAASRILIINTPFGSLSGALANQSVLLMRIGPLTIAEWSHNGKCRAWSADDSAAPKLSRRQYSRENFYVPSLQIVKRYQDPGISHHNSSDWYWQEYMATFIKQRTGISISRSEAMPNGNI